MADQNYRANWMIMGATKKPLLEGDEVRLSDEVAGPLLAAGALSLAGVPDVPASEPAAGEPASAVASDGPSIPDSTDA